MGLAYLGAVLQKENHQVEILDAIIEDYRRKKIGDLQLIGLSYDEISLFVKEKKPTVVGITIPFSAHAKSALEVAKIIKKTNEKIIIVVGGPHATIVPEKCLTKYVDFVIIGEGEETMPELIKHLEKKESEKKLLDIPGIAFLKNKKLIITKNRAMIQNLNKLPFPARHLLNLKKYFQEQKKNNYSRGATKKTTTIITSRGCPFGCVFCSINITMGKIFRPRTSRNVAAELEYLVKKLKIEHIEFEDDNFTFNIRRTNKICDLILKKKLKFIWRTPNGIRADLLTPDLIQKFKKTGCYELWFAPESGSQRVINEVIGKRLLLEKVTFAVKECLKNKIQPNCFFVIGSIGETKNEIKETLVYMQKLRKIGAGCYINIATPLYGTRLYNQAKENNYLRNIDDMNLVYNNGLYLDTPEFKAEEIYELFLEGRKIQRKNIIELITFILKNPKKTIRFFVKKIKH